MGWRGILLWGLGLMQLATFTTTIYLHRGLAHRGLRFSRATALAFRAILWLVTGIVPRRWVAVHRKHHRFTDVEGDPHSPMLVGYWKVQLFNYWLYKREARKEETVAEYAADLAPERLDRALFDRSLVGPALMLGILWVPYGIGSAGAIFGISAVSYVIASAAINALGHSVGKRPFPNTATNLRWLAILSAGEGLHNNHHARPGSARFSARAWEPDMAWPVIRLMERARLVYSVKEAPPRERAAQAA